VEELGAEGTEDGQGRGRAVSYTVATPKTWAQTVDQLAETFRKWGIREWMVTPPRPLSRAPYQSQEDRRVTVRYTPRGNSEIVLTMDRQDRAEDNVRVLYLAIEALRKNELRGIADLVREAYLQLPAPTRQRDPFEVLGVRSDAPLEDIKAMYLIKTKRLHPDIGGSEEAMKELNEAWERIQAGANNA